VFLALTYAGHIPASLTGLIVSRDLFLVYAGLYIRYMSVVPPFSMQKYFDPTLPTATIQPTTISKVNTALQFLLIAVSLGAPILQYQGHSSLHYLWAATGLTTFLSAVSYAFMKNTYKFSHREYDHQFGKKLFAFGLFIMFNIGFTLSFPAQPAARPGGADCPVTGGPDPYSEATHAYYLRQIRAGRASED
jgi:phosphatidylglycerophosphate synthase